ncbi:MAG: TonB-dependent receptor [Elusimicrobiota bacterium]
MKEQSPLKRFGSPRVLLAGALLLGQTPPALAAETMGFEFFEEEASFLNSEVVTASKFAESLADAPGVVSVITKDELERFGGTTLKDILERVPSLIGSTVYMTDRSMIAVRGDQFTNSGSHVLLMINGRPVREVLEGGIKSEMLETFPVNIIERIEVVKGPGSVLYGSEAFSGTINIITEEADKTGATVTGLGGQTGAYGTLGKVKYRDDDLSIIAAGRYHEKPGWNTAWDYTVAPNVNTRHVSIPDKGPGAYLQVDYKNLRLMSSHHQWESYYFLPDYMGAFEALGFARWTKTFADLGYKKEMSEKWTTNFNITYSRSTFEVSSWPDIERDSYELLAEWANIVKPAEKLAIVSGATLNYRTGEELLRGTGLINDSHRTSGRFYAQADYWPHPKIKLLAGLQANKVEHIDLNVVPRAGVILRPASRINIKALYSQAFRAPSINETGLDHPAMKGNPGLECEKVSTIDIGVNYLGERIQGGVNYFFSKQSGVIFQDRSGKYALPTYDNMDEIEHQGFELEGKSYIRRRFFLTGSALYQKSRNKAGDNTVSPLANWAAKAGISYRSASGLTASLFDIYQGVLDAKYSTQVNPSPGAYHLMYLHGRLAVNEFFDLELSQGLSLLLQVDNLLDKELWLPNWGLTQGSSIPVNRGRTIYFGVEMSL